MPAISASDVSARAPDGSADARGATDLARALPEAAGPFKAEALVAADGWVRRAYRHGDTRIEVTVAAPTMSRVDFEAWLRMSAAYPAVALDVPAGSAAGFYDCGGAGMAERCNVHIHFRVGHHVEIMGNGTASRSDVDELLRALPLRSLTSIAE